MKRFIKVISVALCVMTLFSSVNILSFAADGDALSDITAFEEEIPQDETVSVEENKKLSSRADNKNDEVSDDEKVKNSRAENLRKYFENSYKSKLNDVVAVSEELFEAAKMTAAGGALFSVVVPPLIFLLPITVPIGAAAGLFPAAAGAFVMMLSPLIALVKFIVG